jgi:hypothetical protein
MTVELSSKALWQCSDEELLAGIRENEQQRRTAEAQTLALFGEAQNRLLAGSKGFSCPATFLTQLLNISRGEANRRLAHARVVTETPGISGAVVAAPLAAMGSALTEGAITSEHVAVTEKFYRSLPETVTAEEWEPTEKILADLARKVGPAELRRFAEREVRPRLDPDGSLPSEGQEAQPKRRLEWHRRDDGSGTGRFELDAESSEQLDALLSALAAPKPDATGQPDSRGIESRRGDALAEVIALAAGSAERPTEGGEKPQIIVTMSWDDLRHRRSALLGAHYLPITGSAARRLACDAQVIPAVLGSRSEVLDIGRAKQAIPTGIRRAVTLRDKGCAFPGCDRPPAWSECHHVRHWADGGPTGLNNLVMLCAAHHRIVHNTAWEVRIAEDGLPEFLPPDWLDASRTPRRNPLRQRE